MGRWEPDARSRLAAAALDLYLERGFDQTTVADIAERAGVTERTFFRHFSDKREVLFDAGNRLENGVVAAIGESAEGSALAIVEHGFAEGAGFLDEDRRPHSRRRAAALDATPALMERELLKMHRLREAAAAALVVRGIPPVEARIAAEAGGACFAAGFANWIDAESTDDLPTCIHRAFAALRSAL